MEMSTDGGRELDLQIEKAMTSRVHLNSGTMDKPPPSKSLAILA